MKSSDLARELGIKSRDIVGIVERLRGVSFKKGTTIIKLSDSEIAAIRNQYLPVEPEGSAVAAELPSGQAAAESAVAELLPVEPPAAVQEVPAGPADSDEALAGAPSEERSIPDAQPEVSVDPESSPEQFPAWHGDRSTLETRHLGKSYGSKTAVRNVSFSVQTGEVVGLLGPNGAGKTTTFYMVVGAIRPDHGEILLNGKDLRSMPMYQRALNGLGYLPQEPSIFRKLTVRENLKAVLEVRWKSIKKKEDRLDIDEEVQGLLEEFNLTEFADRDGYRLSGGERRRTEIARAVALRPTFLLFDEPFAGIDPIAIIELKKMIVYLKQKGLGILITDHNVRETLSITDRAYIIKDGTVFAAGDPETLVGNRQVRAAYLGEDFRLS